MGLLSNITGLFAGGKLRMLIMAGLVTIGGFVFQGNSAPEPKQSAESQMIEDSASMNWLERGPRQTQTSPKEPLKLQDAISKLRERSWGDAAITLGLSFGIAMIVGTLLRAFVRTMITVLIVVVGGLWTLQHLGYIDPFWNDYADSFASLQTWGKAQFDSLVTFMKGSLPSGAATLIGFGYGLRK